MNISAKYVITRFIVLPLRLTTDIYFFQPQFTCTIYRKNAVYRFKMFYSTAQYRRTRIYWMMRARLDVCIPIYTYIVVVSVNINVCKSGIVLMLTPG